MLQANSKVVQDVSFSTHGGRKWISETLGRQGNPRAVSSSAGTVILLVYMVGMPGKIPIRKQDSPTEVLSAQREGQSLP